MSWSSLRDFLVYVSSYNNDSLPRPGEDVHTWLKGINHNEIGIYVFGCQESSQFQTEEIEIDKIPEQDPSIVENWTLDIMNYINSNRTQKVTALRSYLFKSIMCIVLIRIDLLEYVNDVHIGKWVTRSNTLSGIKGATCLKFDLFGISLCFIIAHLEAQEENYDVRLEEYKYITTHNGFTNWNGASGYTTNIFNHDVCFFLGDLNFRIELPREEVLYRLCNHDLQPLLQKDQLHRAMTHDGFLPGFYEAPITFKPTYKYDSGTSDYDSSDKARTPSWTDRILFKGNIRPFYYNVVDINQSDHKPVHGLFHINH